MKMLRSALVALSVLGITAGAVQGQRFGAQVDWSDDFDLGVGVRVEYNLGNSLASEGTFSRAYLIGSFDYFFPDCGGEILGDEFDCSYFEFNANLAVPVGTPGTVNPYVGAGLNMARFSTDYEGSLGDFGASSTDIGLNLLGGIKFALGSLSSYAEGRFEVGGGEQLVLTFGVLVGGN